jgi:predicted RNase H-like nuclease (RuvC/YqgF family)
MKPVPASGPDAQAGELSKNEIRRRERMIAELEKRITRYEGELEELERELADPALYAGGGDPGRVRQITELRDAASARLPRVYAEWERIGEELAGV